MTESGTLRMIDGIKYIGDGSFLVTEDRLKTLIESQIRDAVGDWVGADNWHGWDFMEEALDDLYPGQGSYPYVVAESIVADIMDNK